ncbi:unnamed protein product [Thlaspi arvense]|uniref:F-box associated beta-propeller type 3 domain-containing protein n=1 Tax=Thlaspi arvense TaxID=13288 RepID=A0AAU9SS75_THLAR|nr:unnamed protein product [Thlaspi arvense]
MENWGGVDYGYEQESRLWILEDAEKQEWSSMAFALPSEWESLYGAYGITVYRGVFYTGERELMVFYPWLESSKPFCVCYYDFNRV